MGTWGPREEPYSQNESPACGLEGGVLGAKLSFDAYSHLTLSKSPGLLRLQHLDLEQGDHDPYSLKG